jgi:hypothetical protein
VITFFDFIFEDWVKLLSLCSKVKRVLFTGSHLRERSQIPAITFFDFICFLNWIFHRILNILRKNPASYIWGRQNFKPCVGINPGPAEIPTASDF